MNQVVPVSAPKAPALAKRWLVVAVAVIATTAASLFGLRWFAAAPAANGVMPTSAAIEAAWGIRITHVAVTADNGLVEMRFLDHRLANSVSCVPFSFRQNSPPDQCYSHDDLHHEVEVCLKRGARAEESLYWKESQHN